MKNISIYDEQDEILDEVYNKFDLMPHEVVQGLMDDYLDEWLRVNYGKGLSESLDNKKSKLFEKQWKYKLKSGRRLRELIDSHDDDDEDFIDVLDAIRDCYYELLNYGLCDEDDIERWTEDFELEFDDLESVDYELSNLYDFCDDMEVWVEI